MDRYLVLMKAPSAGGGGLTANALGTSAVRLGGSIERAHADIGMLQVRGLTATAAAQLAKQPGVEAVVRDRRVRWIPPKSQWLRGKRRLPSTQADPRDAAFLAFQWNLRVIKALQAWNITPQGRGVTVCILDTGVDNRHIDLRGKVRFDISTSFVHNERADRDHNLHGTSMASVVSGNGLGIAAVAPEARLCSVKVLDVTGSGTFGDVAAGMVYVGDAGRIDGTARVDVANMSLGALLPNNADVRALAQMLQRAADIGTKRGVLFVGTAGNEATNLNNPNVIHLPSQLANVLSVGATGPINQRSFDRIASYSNRGRNGVDIYAPGGEFAFANNVLIDLVLGACSPSNREPGFEDCANQQTWIFNAGTSPAAAHVSGAAAIIESKLPGNQTPAQLTNCLLRFADPLPNPLISANGRLNVFRSATCGTSANVASR